MQSIVGASFRPNARGLRVNSFSSLLRISSLAIAIALTSFAFADHCPADRPFHRGQTACDSCDWRTEVGAYVAGELSTTRESSLFHHQIKVSVVCDANRPVDVNDVFEKLERTETVFAEQFKNVIDYRDGIDDDRIPLILEIVVGICDYYDDIDDCVMYTICEQEWGWSGCGMSTGKAFRNTPNDSTRTAFVPFNEEGKYWWVEGNRYANLQHEFTHLLDYTYLDVDWRSGPDTAWWTEGLAQFVQWRILNDRASWTRGNDAANLLDVLSGRPNANQYYDGMRVFAYLSEYSPWFLDELAEVMREGTYKTPDIHLKWHNLHGYMAWRHQDGWRRWLDSTAETRRERSAISVSIEWPGYVDAYPENATVQPQSRSDLKSSDFIDVDATD